VPLVAPVDLPPQTRTLIAADIDDDGVNEVVAVSRAQRHEAPDAVDLWVLELGPTGLTQGETVPLGNAPTWFDPHAGLWTVRGDGLYQGGVKHVELVTPLASLGPTTPARSTLVHDLDNDGAPEILVWAQGQVHGFRPDGQSIGAVAAPATGALDTDTVRGGEQGQVTLRPPSMVLADADGDGLKDVLLPGRDELVVHVSGPATLGARTETWALPEALETPPTKPGAPRRTITDIHLTDLSGDGKVDLLVHRIVSEQGFFGATAELSYHPGTGSGFGEGQVLSTGRGSFEVHPTDVDGDGDQDLVLLSVDTSFGSLAKGLVARSVPVQMQVFVMQGAGFAPEPLPLREVQVSLQDPQAAWNLAHDFDDDGVPDLVVAMDGQVAVFRGRGGSFEDDPMASAPVQGRVQELLVADLNGDGRPEVVAWQAGADVATLLVLGE
jgi:hypothetical protein